jgi:hypothetical protein
LREFDVFTPILFHISGLVSGDASFNVKKPPRLYLWFSIINTANNAVGAAVALLGLDRARVNYYLRPEISAAFTDRSTQRTEEVVRVGFAVDCYHVVAAPPDEFIKAEVFEVASVGKIQEP